MPRAIATARDAFCRSNDRRESAARFERPVSYENRDPPNWGSQVPIFIEKWGPGPYFHNILGTPGSPFS